MTIEDAITIKGWRVKGASWRRVAELAAQMWPLRAIESGNQIEGRDLCQDAAIILGEDHRDWE